MVYSGKFGIKKLISSSGTLGIFDITSDTQIRVIVENAGPTNTVAVYGKIQGQNGYQLIDTVVGSTNKLIEVALFDFLELEVIAYDTIGNYIDIAGSGFITGTGGGAVASNVTVTNFPNPQNVAVVNTPLVLTDLAANTPSVSIVTAVTTGTEYSLVLPTNTRKIKVKVRNYTAKLNISYASGGNYYTLGRGCSYDLDLVQLASGNRTIYFTASKDNTVIEVLSWV
jgi:hypothetical protein